MKKSFFEQEFVQPLFEGIEPEELFELEEVGILKCHSDIVTKLPPGAQVLGSSSRTANEIWHVGD